MASTFREAALQHAWLFISAIRSAGLMRPLLCQKQCGENPVPCPQESTVYCVFMGHLEGEHLRRSAGDLMQPPGPPHPQPPPAVLFKSESWGWGGKCVCVCVCIRWVRFTHCFFPFEARYAHTHTQQSSTCSEMCENHIKCAKCGSFGSMPTTHLLEPGWVCKGSALSS